MALLVVLLLSLALTVTPAWADITSNLSLWWAMDEGSGSTLTASAGSTTGTLGAAGAAPTRLSGGSCKFSGCLSFDGTDDVVTLSYTTGTTYTIAMWVWNDSTATQTYATLFTATGGASGLYLMQAGGNDNKLNMYFDSADHFSTGTVPTDTWAHIAVVVTPSATTFYINGTAAGTNSPAPSVAATLVGVHTTNQEGFQGRLDDLRVYSRALSASDITELVAWNPSALPTVTITGPTSAAILSTAVTPLTGLAGTASSTAGTITSVTWSCPTCSPMSGTASGTTSWSVASIGLSFGANVITVAAHHSADAQVGTDTLTVTLTGGPPTLQPQIPRVGPNLITNPNFNGTSSWALGGASTYDSTQSRTADGTGSVRIPAGQRLDSALGIPVTPGKTYVFSAYLKVTAWPPAMVDLAFSIADAAGNYLGYGGEGGMGGNSTPNTWEETTIVITPGAGINFITLIFYRGYADWGAGDLWVDEAYFGEGIGFGSPPTAKIPFDGANVRADALGNITVLKGGTFQPFFPLCIYSDGRRPNNYQVYSSQGWNCDMWGYSGTMQPAANAVSSFNPDGMMTSLQMVQYTNTLPGGGFDADGHRLEGAIQQCKDTGLFASHFLFYYWDNEQVWTQWDTHMAAISQTQEADKVGGVRTHPLYMLQGSYNATRTYHTATGTGVRGGPDITGTYGDALNTGGAGHAGGQEVMWNQEGQNVPITMQQMNIATASSPPGELRRLLYTHVGRGAKGIGIWRDCYANDCGGLAVDVTQTPWWPDLPNLRREIDQLLPLIRQPHWTTWQVAYNAALPLTVGTRQYQGQGYLIVSNSSAAAVTVTFTLTGLPYTPQRVVNYFNGQTVTTVSGNAFTVTLPALGLARGTAVYQIAGSATTAPVINSPASAVGTVGSPFTYQITATNGPTSYDATPLPAGLSVDTASGLISGTPTAAGTSNVTLSASNNAGTGTTTLSLSFRRIKRR